MLPDFVTHYYLPDRRPFLNLSELDDDGVEAVVRDMATLRAVSQQHRPFGRRYMELRRLTEDRLRDLFIARGHRPRRTAMEFGPQFGVPQEPQPYHGRVFLLAELDEALEEFGLPDASWGARHEDFRQWPQAAYLEIQLWADDPIRDYLG